MLASIRGFFQERGVLEVETPLLWGTAAVDPNLQAFVTRFRLPGQTEGDPLFLQTSPEFAMKRLLAAGSGSIYQICKAFRNEEMGRYHNPEFTLLEWYRVGFGLEQLMDEIDELFHVLLTDRRELQDSERVDYRRVFEMHTGVDPLLASTEEMAECAIASGLPEAEQLCGEYRPLWLDLLFSHLVQPQLGRGRLTYIYDYPACLPSLARQKPGNAGLVERVEVFLDGLELGNGFHELTDAQEQDRRFEHDLACRRDQGLSLPPKDRQLLAALEAGLPDCSGVALGLDRILMLATGADEIREVLAFPLAQV